MYKKEYMNGLGFFEDLFENLLENNMNAISYTSARANLSSTMANVCNDHTPIIITRKSESPVVMMSLEDYNAMQESTYLLRSPANARNLLESIAELEVGKGIEKTLIK
jgi:antitoxin YefM